MSPRRGDRRKLSGRQIGGAAVGAAIMLISIGALISNIGGNADIPSVPVGDTVHGIDLLASRDLNVNGDIPAGGVDDNMPLVADQTWTRTGGESCYPIGSADASCFAASEMPYTVDATGTGWVTDPDARNGVLNSTNVSCSTWTCVGGATATYGKTAPDGSATATELSISSTGMQVQGTASGYSNNTTVYPRMWVKCTAGTIRWIRGAGTGDWRIVCATASAGAWVLINSGTQTGVSEPTAWTTSATGTIPPLIKSLSGAMTVQIWGVTITEEPGTRLAIIKTAGSAVLTGDPAWVIDNSSGKYYKAGDTVTQTISQITGTCWVVSGTDLLLSGAAGSECSGIWYGLNVSPP